ncbi:MAG TPA: 4-hydroxy-tetrahydrodipicolinate reductase [Micropepsaceae bacterium]|nr:4-hydroxy-tetrahydrodipicolinate reductase [Micropepsaceae bacterium]
MTNIRVTVAGASGRMGRTLIRALAESDGMQLAFALERPGHAALGADAGVLAGLPTNGIAVTHDSLAALAASDAVLDFTTPAASVPLSELAAQARIVHVIGTTGFSENDLVRLKASARHAVIVKSGNMSLGVNLLAALVREAAKVLPNYDVEIVEMHHRMKVDAPSGTALLLGEAAAEGRNLPLKDLAVRGRDGQTGPRPDGAIGFASLRGGTVVGDHTVTLAGPFERIELSHRAEDRMIFAKGALTAARWGQGQKPGLYAMSDVLGLSR